ncbi:RNA-binding protein [Candidatus Pacearchaeota archaeon]|nr:RNA-binding protein [Candidatus Pacearchaeota archaeon]
MTETIRGKETTATNDVFIGSKPFMKYVIAVMIQLEQNNSAIIKARGKFISRGVDVAEVVKKRIKEKNEAELMQDIIIGTDAFENDEGKKINVSTIDISLKKN